MLPRTSTTAPPAASWVWGASAVAAALALVTQYGFHEPILRPVVGRTLFIIAMIIFAGSRVMLLFPASELRGRMQRWWVDYAVIVLGGIWWIIEPAREPIIIHVGATYLLLVSVGAASRALLRELVDRILTGRQGTFGRILVMLTVLGLLGGLVLSLPACWSAPVTGQKLSQHAMHVLNCVFTATAAVTCTGLSPLDIGEDFTLAGHITILILLQMGALIAILLGIAVAIRLREGIATTNTRPHFDSVMRWGATFMIVVEVIGAAILHTMWSGALHPMFGTPTTLPGLPGIEVNRLLFSVFHSVSAFCNGGLTLSRDGLGAYAWQWQLYASILPLMVLGSIGLPALHDLWLRLRRRETGRLSAVTRVTLVGTFVLLLGGAGLLLATESTRYYQLRYPRETTPGRLQVAADMLTSQETQTADERDGGRSPRRLWDLPTQRRALACLVESAAARTGGFQIVRLDEPSLTPAGRWLLMLLMLVGGGIGGTAGGVRIFMAWLCVRSLFKRGETGEAAASALRAFAGVLILIAGVSAVLLYRDVGSFEASLFESVSACCNVGLSTGLTRQLFVEGKVALVAAMLVGRSIPLGLLGVTSQVAVEAR